MESIDAIYEALEESSGVPAAALTLLTALLCQVPLSILYKLAIQHHAPLVHNIYFALTGYGLAYFLYRHDSVHSLASIVITYTILRGTSMIGMQTLGAALVFLYNMYHLIIIGYLNVSTDGYDIDWTTPQCILCLRLIGVGFDVMDGAKSKGAQKKEKVDDTALAAPPSIIEILGYSYCFCGFLVGPQFSIRRYQSFVSGNLYKSHKGQFFAYFHILVLALVYLAMSPILSAYVPESHLHEDAFYESDWFHRYSFVWLFGRVTFMKYVGVWLLSESACILIGLSYEENQGEVTWTGMQNIDAYGLETAPSLKKVVATFNIKTNQWMMRYMYKRLRWMGNRHLSQLFTLIFLAIWHGLYTGYYMSFVLEFFSMAAEGLLMRMSVRPGFLKYIHSFIGWVLRSMVLGVALTSFTAKDYPRSKRVWESVQVVPIACLVLGLLSFVIPARKPPSSAKSSDSKPKKE